MFTRRNLLFAMNVAAIMAQDVTTPTVQVVGAVKNPLTLTAEELQKMPRTAVQTSSNGMETSNERLSLTAKSSSPARPTESRSLVRRAGSAWSHRKKNREPGPCVCWSS